MNYYRDEIVSDTANILAILNQQNTQLCELEHLLKDEYEVLQHHNPSKLTDVNKLKNELLIKIDETDKLLASNTQFIEDKKNGLYADELHAIENILLSCKDLNQVNGAVVQKSQISIERMRNTLLENNTKSTLTYDSKGKTSGGLNRLGIKA